MAMMLNTIQDGDPEIRELHQSLLQEDFDEMLALPVLGDNTPLMAHPEVCRLFEGLSQPERPVLKEGIQVLQHQLGPTQHVPVCKDWPVDIPTKQRIFLAVPDITNRRTNQCGGRASGSGKPKHVQGGAYTWRRYSIRCCSEQHTYDKKMCAALGCKTSKVHEDGVVYLEDKVWLMGLNPTDESRWERVTLKGITRYKGLHDKTICRPKWVPTLITEELRKEEVQGTVCASEQLITACSMLMAAPVKASATEHGSEQQQQQHRTSSATTPEEMCKRKHDAATSSKSMEGHSKRCEQSVPRHAAKRRTAAADSSLPQQDLALSPREMLQAIVDLASSHSLVQYAATGPVTAATAAAAGAGVVGANPQVPCLTQAGISTDTGCTRVHVASGHLLESSMQSCQLQSAVLQPSSTLAHPLPAAVSPSPTQPVMMTWHVQFGGYKEMYQSLRDAIACGTEAGVASFQELLGSSPRIQLFRILQKYDMYERSLLQLLVTPTYQWDQEYYGQDRSRKYTESGALQLKMLGWLCRLLPASDMMQLLGLVNGVSHSAALHTAARHAAEWSHGHQILELLLAHSTMEHITQHTKGNYLALQCAARSQDVHGVELLVKHAQTLLLQAGLPPSSVQVLLFQREDPWFQAAAAGAVMQQACDRMKTVPAPLPPDNAEGSRHVSTAMQLLIEVNAQAYGPQRQWIA